MQFINTLMLLGILAVAIPVIIQILNRKSSKKIYWGAMIFLLDSMRKRRKRVLLEEILLLACRCLIPALAAMALARPFIQPESSVPWAVVMPMLLLSITAFGVSFAVWRYPNWRRGLFAASILLFVLSVSAILFERHLNLKRFGRGAQKDIVIVIDGSSSMSMIHEAESNFDRARKEAEKYIDEAPRGTAFSIVLGGPVPQVRNPIPITDKRVLKDTLDQLHPAHGTMQIMGTLTAAAVTLANGNNGIKQIVIIGDGQTVGWNLNSPDRWKTIENIFAQLANKPLVIWRTLPLPTSIRNLAISDIRLSRDVVGADRQVGIRVTVVNTGTETVTPDEVVLNVDGKRLTSRAVKQLEPGASHTLVFDHKFAKPGGALVEATVVSNDDLPADDTFNFIVPVMDTLKVLIVDGSASADIFRRASTYISLALRPQLAALMGQGSGAGNADDVDFLLETEVKTAASMVQNPDFGKYGVVILSDVPRLPDAVMKELADYANTGGGVLILPGAKAMPDVFNAWMFGGSPMLPIKLAEWKSGEPAVVAESGKKGAAQTKAPQRTAISTETFTHDALRNLRLGTDLDRLSPLQYWRLDEGVAGGAYVAGRFNTGEPFLAIKPVGRGTVALAAMPFDPTISDLPSRRSFVPLMHEIVYYLARPFSADLNIIPSDGAKLLLAPQTAISTAASSEHGLIGIYYKSRGLKGESIHRVDRNIDFNWGGGAPMNGIPHDYFSVLWKGTLVPKESGRYTFRIEVDDRASMKINGKTQPAWQLEKGKNYDIAVTFEEDYGEAKVKLFWTREGVAEEVVPPDVLRPILLGGGEGSGQMVEIRDPYGEGFFGEIFSSENGLTLNITRSLVPGLYSVEVPDMLAVPLHSVVIPVENKILFSVTAGSEESTMEAISNDQADFLRQFIQLSTATKAEDVTSALEGQAFGKEIWRMLALAVFLFLIAEVALTRWIAIQRRQGEEIKVEFENDGPMGKESFKESLNKIRGG